jgi:hypothetical protein
MFKPVVITVCAPGGRMRLSALEFEIISIYALANLLCRWGGSLLYVSLAGTRLTHSWCSQVRFLSRPFRNSPSVFSFMINSMCAGIAYTLERSRAWVYLYMYIVWYPDLEHPISLMTPTLSTVANVLTPTLQTIFRDSVPRPRSSCGGNRRGSARVAVLSRIVASSFCWQRSPLVWSQLSVRICFSSLIFLYPFLYAAVLAWL